MDANGSHYVMKYLSAARDCALLSLLNNPNFHAPLSDYLELRRTIVSFAHNSYVRAQHARSVVASDFAN